MYISATLFCMRPSAGNGRYPQTAKCSRSVPEKIVSRCAAVLLSLRKPACGYRNRILSELQKASFFCCRRTIAFCIVGLCRNPCTGLSMQTGGDMPVFWRRKPCSAGKTGCGKKGSKQSFRYRCIRKKNGIADIIRLRFLAGHCQKKWIFRVFRV